MTIKQKIKILVYGILLLVLCVPFLQKHLNLVKVSPLNGVVETSELPDFSFKDWYSGDFQKKYEAYYEENVGFKNSLVRLYNQIDYSLFQEAHAGNVTVGLDGYLFQQDYIDEVAGKKFIGDSQMDYKVKRLKEAQDFLESQNKVFFTVLAPGKASYFKNFIPAWQMKSDKDTTNYSSFIQKSRSAKLNVLDFNAWFLSMKDTTKYPLYPKQGIHWSYYGMALAADSIFNYISSKGLSPLPQFTWSLEMPDTLRGTDYDIGDLLNLIWKIPHNKMAYPVFQYSTTPDVVQPRVMIIGDSYNWTMINSDVYKNMFGPYIYYYYFNSASAYNGAELVNVEDMVLIDEIKKYDVVLTLQSEGNYNNIGFGFEEKLLNEINGMHSFNQEIFNLISKDTKYIPIIKTIMKDRMLDHGEALAYLTDSLSREKASAIRGIISTMRNNPEWLNSIRKKAEGYNISLEEAMRRDAEWLYDRDHN